MKLRILTTALLCCLFTSGYTQQHKTTIKFSSAAIVVPTRYNGFIDPMKNASGADLNANPLPYDQWGVYAERRIGEKWGIGAGYAFWNKMRISSLSSFNEFTIEGDKGGYGV